MSGKCIRTSSFSSAFPNPLFYSTFSELHDNIYAISAGQIYNLNCNHIEVFCEYRLTLNLRISVHIAVTAYVSSSAGPSSGARISGPDCITPEGYSKGTVLNINSEWILFSHTPSISQNYASFQFTLYFKHVEPISVLLMAAKMI